MTYSVHKFHSQIVHYSFSKYHIKFTQKYKIKFGKVLDKTAFLWYNIYVLRRG